MSSRVQSTINFSVRKSSRTTNRVNYNEKKIEKSVISDSEIKPKTKTKTKSKTNEINGRNKSEPKTRKHRITCNNQLDENEDKLSVSPTKVKKTSELKQNISLFSATKQLLSPSIVDSVIGRDAECTRIREWVSSHLESKQAASLYISGSAGTGKTLSVTRVMNQLKQSFDYKLITINCMSFRNSNSIYTKILNQLNQKTKFSKQSQCLQAINDLLIDHKSDQMIVLVLDEMDQLDTKSHDILNNIFLWTKPSKSRLILIGIANSLDLTSRMLSTIKALNLSNVEEMHFIPYNTQQIISILEDRIRRASQEKDVAISSAAIQFCARKIGANSGDIRKALDVCQRALHLVETNDTIAVQPLKTLNDDGFNSPKKIDPKSSSKCVGVAEIMSVLNQVYGNQLESESKRFVPFNQQIILCALLLCGKHKNLKEVKLYDLKPIFDKICAKRGINYDNKSETDFLNMCQLLEDYGFVSIKRVNQNIRNSKLSLRVNDTEIEHSLSDKQFLNSILNQSSAYLS